MKIEVATHGIDHPDYFQGAGVAFTDFTHAFTGIGNSESEAYNDAIDLLIQDQDVENLSHKERIELNDLLETEYPELSNKDVIGEDSECFVHVTIRLKLGEQQ